MTTTSRTTAFLFAVILGVSCGTGHQSILLSESARIDSVLKPNLYAPLKREALFDDPVKSYGEPDASVVESTDPRDFVRYQEYRCDGGRVRVYTELIDNEEDSYAVTWLQFFPSRLYLEDILQPDVLRQVQQKTGIWKVTIAPDARSWYLSVELDGRAVTCITEFAQLP
jgi:hypothetical protein